MFGLKSTAMRRMFKAREKVVRSNPFFASLLFQANLVESRKHKTIWSDGVDIVFNPDYVSDKANDPYIEGIVLHTVLHLAMLHSGRRRYRDEKTWNDACDFPVNDVVENYFRMPKDALRDKNYAQMAPERIYELLDRMQQPQNGEGDGQGKGQKGQKGQPQKGKGKGKPQDGDDEQDGGGGSGNDEQEQEEQPGSMFDGDGADGEDGEGKTPEQRERERENAERDWKRALSNAMEKSPPGSMPGNMQRLIQQLFPTEKIDWKDLIRDMSRDAKSNITRTWQRPNRRRLGNDEYMPGNGIDQVFRLVMCMDVSGSVSQQMIQEMCSEAASLLDQNLVTHVTLLSVDTRVQRRLEAHSAEDLVGWNAGGGGGTDFRTAMDEVGQMDDVVGCIFLTDMMTSSFGKEPPFPTVWVDWSGGNSKAPYGRTVPYK